MIRKIKALGLGLVAMLALGALGAAGASAQNGELYAEGATNEFTLTGAQTGAANANRITAFGSFIECPGTVGTGHAVLTHTETTEGKKHQMLQDGASKVTVTPHYSICYATALKFPMTIIMNGCDYEVNIGETTGGVDTYGGSGKAVCPGKGPEWKLYKVGSKHTEADLKCVFTTLPNQEYKGLHATDTTNGTISITGEAVGFTVTQHEGPAKGCLSAATSDPNVKLDADVTITAHDEEGSPVGIGLSHK